MNKIIEKDIRELYNSLSMISLKNKKILITGASGMLASYLVFLFDYLNQNDNFNISVYLLLRNLHKAKLKFGDILEHKNITILEQDVCTNIVTDTCFDYIIHAASLADPNSIIKYPYEIIKANTLGTINVCEVAKKNKAEIIFLSTREVYGDVGNITSINESCVGILDQLNSRSCYPESKKCAEALLVSNYNENKVPFKIVRIAHSYGPGMQIKNDGRIMSDLINNMVNNEDILLKSEGKMKRAFCYISDAISAILYVMLYGNQNEVYNIANEKEEIEIRDLAKLIAKKINKKVIFEIQTKDINNKGYLQIPRVKLDTSKLENLGWQPKISLNEGIDRTYNSFKNR